MPNIVGLQMEKLAELLDDSKNFNQFNKDNNYNAYFLYALKYDGYLGNDLEDSQ